jgi:flagellar biosynthesis/type III secretory pathway chaperone
MLNMIFTVFNSIRMRKINLHNKNLLEGKFNIGVAIQYQ